MCPLSDTLLCGSVLGVLLLESLAEEVTAGGKGGPGYWEQVRQLLSNTMEQRRVRPKTP